MMGELATQFPASKLRSLIGLDDATCQIAAFGHSVSDDTHSKRGFHLRVIRVADDPATEGFLPRADIQLILRGFMLSDIGQPELVRPVCDELMAFTAALVDDDAEVIASGVLNAVSRYL